MDRSPDSPGLVGEQEFEVALALVRAKAAGADEGVFGPASLTWRIDREAAIFLGAGRALLLQLAHPWVAAAIAEHSQALSDPIGRFHRTFATMFSMVFGSLDHALDATRRLYRRHASITGILPQSAGPFDAGSGYRANEAAALQWVHASLVDTALVAHDLVLPPLGPQECEQYWAENRLFAALFGLQVNQLPKDWAGFGAYTGAMLNSDTLSVTPAARDIAGQIFRGTRPWLRPPAWYMAMTAMMLPQPLRAGFGLEFGAREQSAAERALRWLRRVYPRLPERLRYVGPYQEAMARLRGRPRPDAFTRVLNRGWIGRPTLRP